MLYLKNKLKKIKSCNGAHQAADEKDTNKNTTTGPSVKGGWCTQVDAVLLFQQQTVKYLYFQEIKTT